MSARNSMPRLFSIIFLMALAMLTACRNGGNSFAVEQQVQTTCSETCARRGQCGTLPDNQRAVLANSAGPAVSLHDRYFTEGTVVTILAISEHALIAAQNGVPLTPGATPFPHNFYQVSTTDKTAWVSEWCLARP